jgi:hypothetical protein
VDREGEHNSGRRHRRAGCGQRRPCHPRLAGCPLRLWLRARRQRCGSVQVHAVARSGTGGRRPGAGCIPGRRLFLQEDAHEGEQGRGGKRCSARAPSADSRGHAAVVHGRRCQNRGVQLHLVPAGNEGARGICQRGKDHDDPRPGWRSIRSDPGGINSHLPRVQATHRARAGAGVRQPLSRHSPHPSSGSAFRLP